MPQYRSRTSTHGRNMAGARALWRATGMKDGDFGKPIIAVVNSFTQFVPGHVHLKDLGNPAAADADAPPPVEPLLGDVAGGGHRPDRRQILAEKGEFKRRRCCQAQDCFGVRECVWMDGRHQVIRFARTRLI